MTIPLHTPGGFFTRFGHIAGGLQDVNAIRGAAATARVLAAGIMTTRVAQLETDYAASPVNTPILNGSQSTPGSIQSALAAWQGVHGTFLSYLSSLAQQTLVTMANQDQALAQQTVAQALDLLISQMNTASKSVQQSVLTIGAQTNVGTPNGNPVFVLGGNDNNGLALQYAFGELITFTCSADSQGSATLNQEQITVTTPAADSNELDYLWPLGSGIAGQTFNLIDPNAQSQTDAQALNNSGFETQANTPNLPDQWTAVTGAAGTDIFIDGTNTYTGAGSLKFLGTAGALQDAIKQQFSSSTGTTYKLKPLTTYILNFWVRVSATPAAGVLTVDLIDGTNTVINDAQSVANTVSKNLTGVSTSWVNVNAVFRTPAVLPAAQYLRIRLSTAIDNGKFVNVDSMSLNKPANQLYAGGPWCAGFSGNTKTILKDQWTIQTTQTWGVIQQCMEQLFNLRALGRVIPFSNAPTELDSLVT